MENQTIKSILREMHDVVERGQIVSPAFWLDHAIFLSALWQDLKDEKTKAEIAFLRVVEHFESTGDISHARAVTKAKTIVPMDGREVNEYQLYRYLEGRDKIIEQYIMLSKKRAQIENDT